MRTFSLFALLFATSCASCPPVDEEAIATRIRAEILRDLERSNAARRAQRGDEEREIAEAAEEVAEDPHERFRVPIEDAPSRGARAPLVWIVMFSDYQCPFCGRVVPTIERLLEEFPNEVRLVYRHNPLPFHQAAMPAAEASMEAFAQGGDALFWRYHALLFENQMALSRADLESYAATAGLDVSALSLALDDHRHQARISADQEIAARLGARGTPTFFINGRELRGAQPYEQFEIMVQEEIAIARSELARGMRRDQLYARRMRDAADTVPSDEPPAAPRAQPDPDAVYRVPIDGRPTRGPADALVTIVQFSEFQCPFCQRVLPTLRRIEQHYGRDVRIVFRNNPLPFHENAMPAAEAAAEVLAQRGVATFFRYHDLLFENQQTLDRATLLRLAAEVGANPRRVERALDDHTHRARILEDQQLAQSLGATGTPSFFINGRNLRGAQPFEAFQEVIDYELARARERVASGTRRSRVYEETIANGATSAQVIPAGPAAPTAAPTDNQVYAIAVPQRAPSRGPNSARVTIQIFSDFQCPFCSRVRSTIDQVLAHYGDRVRLVWRDYPLPFHASAMPAAEIGREVFRQGGDRAFWAYHDRVFENQQAGLDEETLVRLAGDVRGIDAQRVRRALASHEHQAAVQADMTAVSDAGARIGTPSFFINGRLIQGAQPFEAFRAAIDRALTEAAR